MGVHKLSFYSSSQKGFSLLEALLAIFVITGVFLATLNVLKDYGERVIAQSTSEYMESLSDAIYDIIENPLYFEEIYAEANAQTNGVLEITLAELIAGGFTSQGIATIPPASGLDDSFSPQTPLKTGVFIMVRVADNRINTADSETLQILLATDERVDDKQARMVASFSEFNGGVYRNSTDNIVNAYGAWDFSPLSLIGTNWFTTALTNLPSPSDGVYLFYTDYVSFDEIVGDYLYRVQVSGRPELNQMYTDLDMGGQNILGADSMTVSQDANFASKAVINGSVDVQGNAIFNESVLTVDQTLSTQDVTVNGAGTPGNTGQLSVAGSIITDTGSFVSNIDAEDATFRSGLEVNSDLGTSTITTTGTINATTMNVTRFDADDNASMVVNGQMSTGQIDVENDLTINGDAGVLDLTSSGGGFTIGGDVNASVLNVEGSLNVGTFGSCDNGC